MIHLDTNILSGSVQEGESVSGQMRRWLQRGEKFAVSSIAWTEFLNGSFNDRQIDNVFQVIEGRVVAVGLDEAQIASKLFKLASSRRGSLADCLIAATAISSGASLATRDRGDFIVFVSSGLRLA